MNKTTTIAIVGAGAVGTTTAYALILKNIPASIILIDVNETRCAGEIMDLSDVTPLHTGVHVRAGTPADAQHADIIIIAAGKRQEPGQSRIELLEANKAMLITLINQMKPFKKTALMLIVTNPLDILAYHAQRISALPHNQVFGTGTLLDTLRMKQLLAQKLGVHEASINAYIIGEHGDHQFPAWSVAEIGGKPLHAFTQLSAHDLDAIVQNTKNKAYEIIACKGSTFYGIATCAANICKAIIFDEKQVLPLSCYNAPLGVYLSIPAVVGNRGIEQIIEMPLNNLEKQQLSACAHVLQQLL
jgi:L-lactate dehydrogenase